VAEILSSSPFHPLEVTTLEKLNTSNRKDLEFLRNVDHLPIKLK
jgi:hypothetical protein